jgi:hypothetical protein
MATRLDVGIEPGGYAQLCMVCPPEREEPHDRMFVLIAEWGDTYIDHGGIALRLCPEHLDELSILILEALS